MEPNTYRVGQSVDDGIRQARDLVAASAYSGIVHTDDIERIMAAVLVPNHRAGDGTYIPLGEASSIREVTSTLDVEVWA